VKGLYHFEVLLDGGVIKTICQQRGKMHKGWLVCWEKSTFRAKMAIKSTKINAPMLWELLNPMCRRSEALGEEEMGPTVSTKGQAGLQGNLKELESLRGMLEGPGI